MVQQISAKQIKGLEDSIEKIANFPPITEIGDGLELTDEGELNVVVGPGGEATKTYVDEGDGNTLSSAKTYTDNKLADYVTLNTAQTISGLKTFNAGTNYIKIDSDNKVVDVNNQVKYGVGISNGSYNLSFPTKSGTFALLGDIPTVPTKVSDLDNDSGFQTAGDVTTTVNSAIASANVPVITMSPTDPGEGVPLAENHFIAVYEV